MSEAMSPSWPPHDLKPFPPGGKREYQDDRALVLAAVRELAPAGSEGVTPDEVRAHIAATASTPALVPYHLMLLGDQGHLEWRGRRQKHGMRQRVRMRKDAPR